MTHIVVLLFLYVLLRYLDDKYHNLTGHLIHTVTCLIGFHTYGLAQFKEKGGMYEECACCGKKRDL